MIFWTVLKIVAEFKGTILVISDLGQAVGIKNKCCLRNTPHTPAPGFVDKYCTKQTVRENWDAVVAHLQDDFNAFLAKI